MSEAVKIWCRNRQSKYDVSDLPAYSEISCPECGTLLRIPEKFGRYLLERPCGKGGMSTIYRALDPVLARRVAVKVRTRSVEDPELDGVYLNVAQTFSEVNHPVLVKIYDFGQVDDREFLVMPYLDGGDLEYHLRNGSLPDHRTLINYMHDVAAGLSFLYTTYNLVHHDVKPANIVIDTGSGSVKLVDYDLADVRIIGDMHPCRRSWGSPCYLAPERILYGGEDLRGDIYSLGITIYELLTGENPFGNRGDMQAMLDRRQEPFVPLCEKNPAVDENISRMVDRMLAYDPEMRPKYPEIIRVLK